ncbi:MAG: hypothetical protein EXR39_04725 [Betaproteobacteria bacterium]|nr:hypothetical protein [Betaproteobacteria bacterium]
MISRRNFLKNGLYAGGAVLLPAGLMSGKAYGQTAMLDPLTQTKFTNPLVVPPVLNMTRGGAVTISVTQIKKSFSLQSGGRALRSTAWAYNGSSPGPTIVMRRGRPVDVTWSNQLVNRRGAAASPSVRYRFDPALGRSAGRRQSGRSISRAGAARHPSARCACRFGLRRSSGGSVALSTTDNVGYVLFP